MSKIKTQEELCKLIANRDESIHNLVKVLDKRQERIKVLESLVMDWSKVPCMCTRCEFFKGVEDETNCILLDRMAELGLEIQC